MLYSGASCAIIRRARGAPAPGSGRGPGLFAVAAFPIPSKTLYGAARFDIDEAI
jgi:hypothetical protein